MASATVIAVIALKAVGSSFSLIVCLVALVYLLYFRIYRQLLHRLFVALLVSSILFSFSILFEALAVNTTVLIEGNSSFNADRQQVLCTISGALFHYSTWVDILVITVISIWLARITTKTKRFSTILDKEQYKRRIRQKYWEALGFIILFAFPVLTVIPPLAAGKYELNEGTWCRIQLEMNTSDDAIELDKGTLIIGLVVWYVPVFIIMVFVTGILTIANLKLCNRLRNSSQILRVSHSDVLKDGISLSIFLMVIYAVYGINIFTAFYYLLSVKSDIPLWITEAVATVVRGVAILCMFFNKRMCKKVINNKNAFSTNSNRMVQKIFDDTYSTQQTESLITTPSLASDTVNDLFGVERRIQTVPDYYIKPEWEVSDNTSTRNNPQKITLTV